MALRHYVGPTIGGQAVWVCPSCGNQQTTPIEDGCARCGAGRDAKRAAEPPAGPRPRAVNVRPEEPLDLSSRVAFDRWLIRVEPLHLSDEQLLVAAWMAGGVWAVTGKLPEEQGQAEGGVEGESTPPAPPQSLPLTDPRVRATLAAALRFYCENHLNYGTMAGQLTAAEARDLAETIQPVEGET